MSKALFKYQELFDSNMLGIAVTDFKDTVLKANTAFLSMLGYTENDVTNKTLRWSVISPSKYNETDEQKITELLVNKTIIPFEKEYIHKDGHSVPVLVGAEALDDELTYGVCFAFDISSLKESERRKEDFAAFVSHELRTPLSVMKLSADILTMLITQGGQKKEQLATLGEIENQIDKLKILITDLLNMSRYQGNQPSFAMSTVNVHDTVQLAIAELKRIYNRNIVYRGKNNAYVHGNADRLSQVIINLLTNAIRYSTPKTDIFVDIVADTKQVRIQVRDMGMGIAIENQKKIFDKFYRINHADEYTGHGAGIGLYICNEILEQHKGTLRVESELNKGSVFTISLGRIA